MLIEYDLGENASKIAYETKYEYDWRTDTINISMTTAVLPEIKDVIFNKPKTIILWEDGTKTIVTCQDGEPFDYEKGFAMAFMKKMLGNKGNYYDYVNKWVNTGVRHLTNKIIKRLKKINKQKHETPKNLYEQGMNCCHTCRYLSEGEPECILYWKRGPIEDPKNTCCTDYERSI